MEIKCEPVFGDQALFDGAPEDAEIAGSQGQWYKTKSGKLYRLTPIQWKEVQILGHPPLAMRRIIKEPKRWTWEDKKAGRLPEVGAKCRQGHKDEIVVAVTEKFVVTECQDMSVCTTRKDVFMRSYNPIETPAEKAQRLKSEWCAKAAKQLKNLEYTSTITSIYDALLSGELQAPKGGE